MKLSQCKKILKIMIKEKWKKEWTAKDFQQRKWFIGYEASARMSDLKRIYPDLFIIGKKERFRTLSINWEYENIKEIIDYVMN